MDNSFKNLIQSASSVVVLLPTNPSLDEVSSGLSLYLSLKGKKEAVISCPTPMIVEFNRLVGVNKISSDVGNKNLTIRFSGYEASDIERVSYDIDNGQFKLTVIPKPGFPSPKKEQVEMSYSGIAGDTIILIGGASEESFPALTSKDTLGAKLIHIGTKALQVGGEKSVLSFARPASGVSEIVYSLISETDSVVDADIATNLLAGIESASDSFKGQGVTAETFEIVAHLLRSGGQRLAKTPQPDFYPKGSTPSSNLFTQESKPEKKEDVNAPQDWLEPKVYKGTSVS